MIKAICRCEQLAIKLPSTEEKCKKAVRGFKSKSYNGIIANCIGALDGYLFGIRTPTKEEVRNVRSFFFGPLSVLWIECSGSL